MKLFNKDDKQDVIWDMKFEALEQYAIANRNCNIKTGKHMCILSDGTEANIGTWLNTQRGLKRKGALREDKLARMQSLVDKGYLSWNCKKPIDPAREVSTVSIPYSSGKEDLIESDNAAES